MSWWRWGRYRTREEAETVMRRQSTLKPWLKGEWQVLPDGERPVDIDR